MFVESECREAFESEEMADLDKTKDVNKIETSAHQTSSWSACADWSQPSSAWYRRNRICFTAANYFRKTRKITGELLNSERLERWRHQYLFVKRDGCGRARRHHVRRRRN